MTQVLDVVDPSRGDIDEALQTLPFADEYDEFDREEAIYWFAANWHGGQWSGLYAVLSASEYKPGPMTNGPTGGAVDVYEHLERVFQKESAPARQ